MFKHLVIRDKQMAEPMKEARMSFFLTKPDAKEFYKILKKHTNDYIL
jgi:hypothetical protein